MAHVLRLVTCVTPQRCAVRSLERVTHSPVVYIVRCKFSKTRSKGSQQDDTSSSSSDDEEQSIGKIPGMRVMKTSLPSLRIDAVLKSGLGTSRNKIEAAFYESRLRLNGNRVLKKSQQVMEGDEVDLINGPSHLNPTQFLDISRVHLASIKQPDEETGRIPAQLHIFRKLTVENYPDAWKVGSLSKDS